MRNIDKIRKMKPQDLSEFIMYLWDKGCEACVYDGKCDEKQRSCIKGTKKWLKLPYEKDEEIWAKYKEQ